MTKKKTINSNYASAATQYLLTHNNYLILTHKNPDGDTMGSAAALCSALRRAGKTAFLYTNPQVTEKYRKYTAAYFAADDYGACSISSVDVASPDMLAEGFAGTIDCCIDHHPTNSALGKVNLICPEKSACGERAVLHKPVMPQRATFAHLMQVFLLAIRQVLLVVITCKYAQISSL